MAYRAPFTERGIYLHAWRMCVSVTNDFQIERSRLQIFMLFYVEKGKAGHVITLYGIHLLYTVSVCCLCSRVGILRYLICPKTK